MHKKIKLILVGLLSLLLINCVSVEESNDSTDNVVSCSTLTIEKKGTIYEKQQ